MKILSVLIATVAATFLSTAQAQDTPTPDGQQPGIAGFWEVITSSGRFVARLSDITSVSQHEYIIDGAVRVFECTVDTRGMQTARFYFIEPVSASSSLTSGQATVNRITSIANKIGEKTGHGDVDSNVTKHYPDTTHAKTSEYRLQNKATIGQIYDHARRVWAEEKGRGGQNLLIIRGG